MAEYDMVVVGSGFAGSAATLSFLEAAEKAGRDGRVALIESGRLGTWPGASRWSRPFLRLNRDNVLSRGLLEEIERDGGDESDLEYCRRLIDEMPNTVEFMEEHGVNFIHRDEEDIALGFEEPHYVFMGSGGKEIVDYYLTYVVKSENADVFYDHEATELALDDEGRVNGVVVKKPKGEPRTITADKVVLACGGFQGNEEMLAEHLGEDAAELPLVARGARYNQGAGIRMAVEVGADTAGRFDMFHAELVDTRAERYHAAVWGQNYGIVVNEDCERFHDEGEDYLFATSAAIAYDTWRNQNQKSYFITDETVMDRFGESWIYEMTDQPPEQSDTISGLAEKLGLDPKKLEATVGDFNAACGSGEWNPAKMDGKKTSGITPPKSNWANPIAKAPFSAFPMTAHLSFTFGGLKVDADGRVLGTDGDAISGLYAAGEITGLFNHRNSPAISVLRSNAFGRLIGENAARSLPKSATTTA